MTRCRVAAGSILVVALAIQIHGPVNDPGSSGRPISDLRTRNQLHGVKLVLLVNGEATTQSFGPGGIDGGGSF